MKLNTYDRLCLSEPALMRVKALSMRRFAVFSSKDGYQPAPFKGTKYVPQFLLYPEGGEMGRAQVVQAEACGISPHTDMNPILLKPTK